MSQVTKLSLSKRCHSGLFTSRNLFVLMISDNVAAVADMITTTVQKLGAGLKFCTKVFGTDLWTLNIQLDVE